MGRELNTSIAYTRDCRISYWQGYVTGRYYAYDWGARGVVLCSGSFRTWRLRHGNVEPHVMPAAQAALEQLLIELSSLGWHVVGSDVPTCPPAANGSDASLPASATPDRSAISEEEILGALLRISNGSGATAAEVGRELLGDDATGVRHLPQRIGTKLRHLQLQGKVERHENGSAAKWSPVTPR
jgi:hypothetical protein